MKNEGDNIKMLRQIRIHYISRIIVILLLLFQCIAIHIYAQLTTITMQDWESGTIPTSYIFRYDASTNNLNVVNISSPDLPAGIDTDETRRICGNYILKGVGTPDKRILGIVADTVIDRNTLGDDEKIVLQSDIFVPEDFESLANVALLAIDETTTSDLSPKRIFRFGILHGQRFYFSYMYDDTTPLLYKQLLIARPTFKIPGWHRFQMIFQGKDTIICTVDGKVINFDSLGESKIERFFPGIMFVSPVEASQIGYVDNLSVIKVTARDSLPVSPWIEESASNGILPSSPTSALTPTATSNAPSPVPPSPTAPSGTQPLQWYASLEEGLRVGAAARRPVLAMFYSPSIQSYATVLDMLANDRRTQQIFSNFVLVHIDIRSVSGSELGQRYGIFKIPAFIVMNTDGSVIIKSFYHEYAGWSMVLDDISTALYR